MKYYILERASLFDSEYTIVSCLGDNDPLYGNGSWDYFSGPFETIEEAEKELDKLYF